jgi:hypothetical protein
VCASFNAVQVGTLKFALAWSRQDTNKQAVEHTRCLGLCVDLEDDDDDDVGTSQWRDNDSQGCSSWASKDEPLSDDDGADYDVFY